MKLRVFEMRSMATGGAYHRAYLHATRQAFLDAYQFAFAYFGGVFRTLRYDNLKSAVKKVPAVSLHSARTGAFRASSVIRPVATRRAAWNGKVVTSAVTTGCRFSKLATWIS